MTVIEAMGSGVPCVVSAVGGLNDMIENGKNGILCTKREDFVNEIIELLKDENLRKKIGIAALNSSKKYSSLQMASAYLKIYK